MSDTVMAQRWPAADIVPGDVIWSDERGDWMEVRRVEQAFKRAPIYFYGPRQERCDRPR